MEKDVSDGEATVTATVKSQDGQTFEKITQIPRSLNSPSFSVIVPLLPLPITFPLVITLKAETASPGIILFSPIELIVDQPIYLGCFTMNAGDEVTDISSPRACLVHCTSNSMRFSLLSKGNKCSCSSVVDHDVFEEVPAGSCDQACKDEPSEKCGGALTVSLYVAG